VSKRASPVAIGAFVVGALALVVIGLVVFGGINLFHRPLKVVMYFDESVQGLAVGAPVAYRGVKFGTVTQIRVEVGTTRIAVFATLDPSSLAPHPGRRDAGLPLARQPVPGLELLGGGQRLRTEYPVVINARVRRVGVEQLLQRGDARAFLRVGDDGRAGREADVVAVAHRRLISVVSAENCEQRHEKD